MDVPYPNRERSCRPFEIGGFPQRVHLGEGFYDGLLDHIQGCIPILDITERQAVKIRLSGCDMVHQELAGVRGGRSQDLVLSDLTQ